MRIAIPVYRSRVSPVFDYAREMIVLDIAEGRIVGRARHETESLFPATRARQLADLGVEVLVCGGISMAMARMIEAEGIRVVPWVAGDVEEVATGFMNGWLMQPRFAMPGCHRMRRGFGRRWGFGGRW